MNNLAYQTLGECDLHPTSKILNGTIIGKKFRRFMNGENEDFEVTKISENVYVGYYCLIGTGSEIGKNSIIDDKSTIESRVRIGENTLVIYSSQVCNDVEIGNDCVIGGFIGERTKIGNHCRVFGQIVHNQLHPLKNWDAEDSMEPAPVIRDKVFIGFNSIIAGSISIGPRAYITAGSIVTKDIPEGYIVTGKNEIIHYKDWKGNLKNSNLFFE